MNIEDKERVRDSILDAVIACTTEAAGAEISLSQVSCRAGISERTLNRYFPDKEMLQYDAAIKHLRKMYISFLERYMSVVSSGMSGLQRLLLLAQMQVENNKNDLNTARMLVRAYTTALRTAVFRNLPVTGYDAPIRDIVIQCVVDGIKDGSIRKDIVPLDAYLLISSNYMGLVQRLIYICSVDLSEEKHTEKLFHVFNNYLQMLYRYLHAV